MQKVIFRELTEPNSLCDPWHGWGPTATTKGSQGKGGGTPGVKEACGYEAQLHLGAQSAIKAGVSAGPAEDVWKAFTSSAPCILL